MYGDPLVHPQKEDYWGHVNPVGPRGVYDEAKRFGEAITMAYHRTHRIDTRIVRIFNTFGPRMRLNDGRAIPAFIGQALRGAPVTVFGDGGQTRSFQYITDLIDGLWRLMQAPVNDPVNIGNPQEMTLLELAQHIIRLTGSRSHTPGLGAAGGHRRRAAAHRRLVPGDSQVVKILVTGGAGFVGSHVVDRLLDDGHAVEVLDNLSTGRRERINSKARLHVCDLRDARLDEVIATTRPDTVVHVAAQAAVSRSVIDPKFDASINVVGTIALLEACRLTGVRRVIYTSTGGAGYGDTDVLPTPEDHPLRPSSPYGVSKTSAERYVDCWAGLTGGRALTLRLANIYGPRQDPAGEAGVIAIFASRLLAGESCIVNGDGEQTRDYVPRLHLRARRRRRGLAGGRVPRRGRRGEHRHRRGENGQRHLPTPGAAHRRDRTGATRPGEARRATPERARRRSRQEAARVERRDVVRRRSPTNRRLVPEGAELMIDDELKAILACPACKGDLLFEETRIICPACRKAYPVRDGIPVMLISEAEPWSPSR